MRAFDILAAVVDIAFPLPPTDTDFCCPDYPLFPMFPLRLLPDMINYTRKEVKDNV